MLKLCAIPISKPLYNIKVINKSSPNEWKKGDIIPFHKKGDKQIIKNYRRPGSLLPICGKILKKLSLFFKNHL